MSNSSSNKGNAYPIATYFSKKNNSIYDSLQQGSMWVFPDGSPRVLDWALVDFGNQSWGSDASVAKITIETTLDSISQFLNIEFNQSLNFLFLIFFILFS